MRVQGGRKKVKVVGKGRKLGAAIRKNQSWEFELPSPCDREGRLTTRSESLPRRQPPFSPRSALVAHLTSLCHRAITYIISPKITQSNSYLPTSAPCSLFEVCFNKCVLCE